MVHSECVNILEKVQKGELSVAEAERVLKAVDEQSGPVATPEEPQPAESSQEDPLSGLGWWKNAWLIPVWVGTAVLVFSAWLLSWGYTNERFFWFYCSWLPLALGMLILILGVWSRQARWAHVRIHDSGGTKISISVPLPIRLTSWALNFFAPRIPELKEKHLDDLPDILNALGDTHDPISVEVDDEDGDRVRVYIQ
ncbi:MAG: hypothetical protein IH586_12730 [Anaerolineaceae bacterium]|nr:hypothetical protein [Anaerolineaceae bacterium]